MSSTLGRGAILLVALFVLPWLTGCSSSSSPSSDQADSPAAAQQSAAGSDNVGGSGLAGAAGRGNSQQGASGRNGSRQDAPSSAPRTEAEILREERNLPALYLIPGTLREVVAEGSHSAAVDPETGELAFRALVCGNPECPGLESGGEPVRFVWIDPLKIAQPDGSVGFKAVEDRTAETIRLGGTLEPQCPACLKTRDLASETPEVQQQYRGYCQEYVLPETERRKQELGQEHYRLIQEKRKRRAARQK